MEPTVLVRGRWTITVEFEMMKDIAAATEIRPLRLADGSYDQRALDEYTDFVVNVLGIFDRADFEVIEERHSPYSDSYYFDLVKKEDFANKDYKYIVYVRISDHDLSSDSAKTQNEWISNHAQQQKQPKSKSKQVWRVNRITVNKDTYYSYEEALEDLENRLS